MIYEKIYFNSLGVHDVYGSAGAKPEFFGRRIW